MLARARQALASLGDLVVFSGRVYATLLTAKPYLRESVQQAHRITFGSLPVVLFVAMFIGANVVVQGYQVLKMLGAESLIGMFASMALVRELAPVLGAAMVNAKAGSEIASELGSMRIRSQIDAIEVMGVDAVKFLVIPRLVGSIFALPVLTIAGIYAAVAMGYVVNTYQFGLNGAQFLDLLFMTTKMHDLWAAVIKSLVFGSTLAVIQTYAGFHAKHGPQGVGLATNFAVVAGATAIAWLNLIVTGFLY